ncbi:MAG: hypothetical protein CENE_02518 [Candidatus Celerinatantimonas neptuna]|nr:MAG: hypothetical protein CENE_02518 [Candidatus Celerinatantimonas neptuna]
MFHHLRLAQNEFDLHTPDHQRSIASNVTVENNLFETDFDSLNYSADRLSCHY